MASTVNSSDWSTKADLSENTEAVGIGSPPGIGLGTAMSMGHFCYFQLNADTDEDYTKPFDFPILGDFMVTMNASGIDIDATTTADVVVQGSVDGSNWVALAAVIADSDGSMDEGQISKLYDIDTKGVLPYMRLAITQATPSESTILISITPTYATK
jgi:hypothetical protein